MTREDLVKLVESEVASIVDLFKRKNESYGDDTNAFYNFEETAREVLKSDSPNAALRVLLAYVHKHFLALCNRGLDDPEFDQRCRDIIVYMLIALAMRRKGTPKGITVCGKVLVCD